MQGKKCGYEKLVKQEKKAWIENKRKQIGKDVQKSIQDL